MTISTILLCAIFVMSLIIIAVSTIAIMIVAVHYCPKCGNRLAPSTNSAGYWCWKCRSKKTAMQIIKKHLTPPAWRKENIGIMIVAVHYCPKCGNRMAPSTNSAGYWCWKCRSKKTAMQIIKKHLTTPACRKENIETIKSSSCA